MFVAVRDLALGEEITISYVDPGLAPEEKVRLLATQYFIHDEQEQQEQQAQQEQQKQQEAAEDTPDTRETKGNVEDASPASPAAPSSATSSATRPPPPEHILEIDAAAPSDHDIDADHDEERRLLWEAHQLKESITSLSKEREELKKQVAARDA